MKTVIKLIASGLYVGYSPFIQGTLGSFLGVLIYLQLQQFPGIYFFAVMLLYLLGFLVSGRAEEIFGKKDSRRITIDEIASMCAVYLFIKPTPFMIIAGFVLFRIFDIIKPPPAKRAERFIGSAGVMLDDIVAAIYTIIVLSIIYNISAALPRNLMHN